MTPCTSAACDGMGPGTLANTPAGSPSLSQGQHFSLTFASAGTYNYYCTVHGFKVMHGAVTVGG